VEVYKSELNVANTEITTIWQTVNKLLRANLTTGIHFLQSPVYGSIENHKYFLYNLLNISGNSFAKKELEQIISFCMQQPISIDNEAAAPVMATEMERRLAALALNQDDTDTDDEDDAAAAPQPALVAAPPSPTKAFKHLQFVLTIIDNTNKSTAGIPQLTAEQIAFVNRCLPLLNHPEKLKALNLIKHKVVVDTYISMVTTCFGVLDPKLTLELLTDSKTGVMCQQGLDYLLELIKSQKVNLAVREYVNPEATAVAVSHTPEIEAMLPTIPEATPVQTSYAIRIKDVRSAYNLDSSIFDSKHSLKESLLDQSFKYKTYSLLYIGALGREEIKALAKQKGFRDGLFKWVKNSNLTPEQKLIFYTAAHNGCMLRQGHQIASATDNNNFQELYAQKTGFGFTIIKKRSLLKLTKELEDEVERIRKQCVSAGGGGGGGDTAKTEESISSTCYVVAERIVDTEQSISNACDVVAELVDKSAAKTAKSSKNNHETEQHEPDSFYSRYSRASAPACPSAVAALFSQQAIKKAVAPPAQPKAAAAAAAVTTSGNNIVFSDAEFAAQIARLPAVPTTALPETQPANVNSGNNHGIMAGDVNSSKANKERVALHQ
jgi:hypothetical protein